MNEQLLPKAKTAKSAEALLEMAKEAGFPLTEEQAAQAFVKLHAQGGEITDLELEGVSGGGCGDSSAPARDLNHGDRVVASIYTYLMSCNDGAPGVNYNRFIPIEQATECTDLSCRCSYFSVLSYDETRSHSNDPNGPDALYWISCTQCGREFLISKRYLHRT